MPTYEYRCESCGDMEIIHTMTEKAWAECPKCKGKIERLISSTSGRGFYMDDMEPTYHHAARRFYTSKKAFRAATKAHNCIEVGDQTDWTPKPDKNAERHREEAIRVEVEKAYHAVRDGNAPLTEYDKHRCKIINQNLRENNYDRRERDRDGKAVGST